ncbi:aminotransferase class V-fold PLP-dependent enzyme [Streptomyces sp. L7]
MLAEQTGAVIKVIPVDDGLASCCSTSTPRFCPTRTKLVAVTQLSNALGTVVPVEQIIGIGHRGRGTGSWSTRPSRSRISPST